MNYQKWKVEAENSLTAEKLIVLAEVTIEIMESMRMAE